MPRAKINLPSIHPLASPPCKGIGRRRKYFHRHRRFGMILLFLVNLASFTLLDAQVVDYDLITWGPRSVVQGHFVTFVVKGKLKSGPDQQASTSVSGLPPNSQFRFPNQERMCCGAKVWRLSNENPVQILTELATPPGVYGITVEYLTNSGVARSTKIDLSVLPIPEPLPIVDTPPHTKLAMASAWKSHMIIFGKKHCENPDRSLWEGNAWYYDGERVFLQIADETRDASWYKCAQQISDIYSSYVLDNDGAIPSWRVFPRGLSMGFIRNGTNESREAIRRLHSKTYGSNDLTPTVSWRASREVSFALQVHLIAESLGNERKPSFQATVEALIGMYDQWFISRTARYVQPFMVALAGEALIDYYEASKDLRIPWLIKLSADELWNQSWDPKSQSFLYYNDDGNSGPAADLNLLIAPLYGWLFEQTSDVTYRERGDKIFNAGVRKAWLGGGKQFSQNYRWSGKYIQWRDGLLRPHQNAGRRRGAPERRD